MSDNKTAVALLGALGLLTALLTAFATANNGIGRIELNERLLLLIGTWLVLLALVMGGMYFAVKSEGHTIILIAGSSTHLELRVIALIPGQVQGKTKLVGTPIYSAAFGPNSAAT